MSATVVSASVAFPRTSSIREDKPCDAVVMEPSSFDPQRPVRHKKTPRPCRGVFLCLTGRCGSNEEGSMTTASHGLSSRIDEVRGKATEALTTVADIERLHAWERRWLGPKEREYLDQLIDHCRDRMHRSDVWLATGQGDIHRLGCQPAIELLAFNRFTYGLS